MSGTKLLKLRNINDVIHNDFRLIHYAVTKNDIKLFDKLIKKAKLNLNIHSIQLLISC